MPLSLESLRQAMPATGMFAGKDWLLSPAPLSLPAKLVGDIEKLGHRLSLFMRAANDFYFRSVAGKLPAFIHEYLDAGKPPELIEAARAKSLRNTLPSILRPDLLWTESGLALTEIDSVPGGIGLTAWLGQTYQNVIGGSDGMLRGFASIFPQGADILVSAESADYRPEMDWLAAQLGPRFAVNDAESYVPTDRDLYRFFELFDLPNITNWEAMLQGAAAGTFRVSAPFKPWLEEKMWLALFWSRPLREAWRRELRENQQQELEKIIPRSWIIDPTPIPHHAVIPGLGLSSWEELGDLTQKERELVLKASGFSDLAWGSRSVVMGHDVSQSEWKSAVANAIASYPASPHVLQEFHRARLIKHPYFDPTSGSLREMEGRARLCPYFFTPAEGDRIALGGILATIVPADKKIIHGMRDAIIVPCVVES